ATWTSLLRDHLGDHPRQPIDVWLDEGTQNAFRQAARLHSSLLPYLYGLAAEASQTGLPLMRFAALEAPDDPRACPDAQPFFLGPSVRAAPVVAAGAASGKVPLPQGEWVDYWRGTVYPGGQEITVPAPLDGYAPVFARAGALIPLAPDYDSLVPTSSPDVRVYDRDLIVPMIPY